MRWATESEIPRRRCGYKSMYPWPEIAEAGHMAALEPGVDYEPRHGRQYPAQHVRDAAYSWAKRNQWRVKTGYDERTGDFFVAFYREREPD